MRKWQTLVDCPPSSRRYRGGWLSYQCRRLPYAFFWFVLGMSSQAVWDCHVILGIMGMN